MSRAVVITGAAKGLGWSLVESFLEKDYRVLATDVMIDELRSRVSALGHANLKCEKLDVTQKVDFESALAKAVDVFGRCDVLINNAAMTPTTALMDISSEEFSTVLDINLKGTFMGCQVFGQHFEKAGNGRIINMASMAGQMGGTASGAHYASSKGGIITLTKIFARHLASTGTTVNAIAPGPVNVESVTEKVPAEKLQEIIENMVPVKKMTEPALLGSIALLLASDEATTITGATWDINGGVFMR